MLSRARAGLPYAQAIPSNPAQLRQMNCHAVLHCHELLYPQVKKQINRSISLTGIQALRLYRLSQLLSICRLSFFQFLPTTETYTSHFQYSLEK